MTASTYRRRRETTSYDGLGTPSSCGGYGVQPPGCQRAAPKHAPRSEGQALQRAVGPQRLECVGRAARMEAASPDEHAADRVAVCGDDRDQRPAQGSAQESSQIPHHRKSPASVNSFRISSIRSGAFERPKGPRATRTTSCPSRTRGQSARDASRSRRRARLRATAPPTRFPVTQAAREGPCRGATYSTTRSDLWGLPSRSARRMAGGSTRSDAEPGPALPAAPGKDRSAGSRAHPRSETVRSLPSARAGLIGPLHGGN